MDSETGRGYWDGTGWNGCAVHVGAPLVVASNLYEGKRAPRESISSETGMERGYS